MATETAPAEDVAPAPRRRRGTGRWRATSGLLATPTIWLIVFFVVPVVMVGLYSVGLLTLLRNDDYLSLEHWRFFLTSPTYLGCSGSRCGCRSGFRSPRCCWPTRSPICWP